MRLGRNIFFLAAALSMSAAAGAVPATGESTDPTSLVVMLDRDAYISKKIYQLEIQIDEAYQNRPYKVRVNPSTDAGSADALIPNISRDKKIADAIERQFVGRRGYSVERVLAETILIADRSHRSEPNTGFHQTGDSTRLIAYIKGLRSLPTGLDIESEDGGALVRSSDPDLPKKGNEFAGGMLVFAPISQTSWHVSLSKSMADNLSPADRITATGEIAMMLRERYAEPTDLGVKKTAQGIEITVVSPQLYGDFIGKVKHVFAQNSDFTLSETPSLLLRVVPPAPAQTPALSSDLPGPSPAMELLLTVSNEIVEIADPPVDMTVNGETVVFHARDRSREADCALALRDALADRSDLLITANRDHALSVGYKSDSLAASAIPTLNSGQLTDAVATRLKRLNIVPVNMSSLDAEHARVTFASETDAERFRESSSKRNRLSMHIVDDGTGASPPSPGDEKFHLSRPDSDIWVKPDAIITGDMIAVARAGNNSVSNQPDVEITFNDEGRERFAVATRENVGRTFAVIVDGNAIEAPRIIDPIEGGTAMITGNFTAESASALAASLLPPEDGLLLKIE